ncbi:MAG: 3-hydroxyacyl-CoA dehydrogenase NAD-binding domain-containing protein [Candidatus Eremiobacteraeota bacterium]|nr:3-hydroxyacyl-CoA dehydrogenase NAD-binding domain-containing protein [Candidatus Eremiobacteraeota bacterium]
MENRVIVVGAGTMGTGIALVAARAGCGVQVIEPDSQARERGIARTQKNAARLNADAAAASIVWSDRIPERSDATIAIEAVPERFDLKREVFGALAEALAPKALLATNTSSLCVQDLADVTPNAERVVGMHFFNPPISMELVEIVASAQTSQEALDRARAFVAQIGKSAVFAADTPGFIVNRVARPFYLQSLRALEAGVAAAEELDALARCVGFRMGPFELMDLIGMDVNASTSDSIYERLQAPRLAPVELQRRMVQEGRLGRKSGSGFYDYSQGPPERLDLTPEENVGEPDNDERIVLIGFGGVADEMAELLQERYAHIERIEHDEFMDTISADTTIAIDVGDGITDRGDILAQLDSVLAPEAVIFADAYATEMEAVAGAFAHPERLVGYGIVGSLQNQGAVEIVDSPEVSDDALALAQELFASMGKGVVLVEPAPGLYLGRVIASIVNEAVIAVHEEVASPDDIDLAMRLGVNYPIGPIAWGREIGGARVARILHRVADAQGSQFAPNRALWVLDVDPAEEATGDAGA